ncbi:hypothetical protein DEO72_LG3g1595 [Vigna unguiculata]|uniref:Uncharacterized protein n=1 Tax=Vigna unguiculata TaxID=3917 RepID=A0A4D6LFU2_VIGUN|nr:hypothetical protein DEO72_LG3g1595 [Vigna unguiculata]
MVPNLQDSLVDVHVHGGTKRKVKLPIRVGKGKDVKKVRAAVMRAVSASGVKGSEAGLIELPETTGRKDIEINVPESLINSIDNMEPRALKGVRQASFFYENVDANDVRFDVNKDVVDGVLIDEEESSPEGNGENEAVDADVGVMSLSPCRPKSCTWVVSGIYHHQKPSPFHRQLARVLPSSSNHFRNLQQFASAPRRKHEQLHHRELPRTITTFTLHLPRTRTTPIPFASAPIINPSRNHQSPRELEPTRTSHGHHNSILSSRTSMAAAPPLAKKKDTFESALQNANQSSHCAARCWSNYKLLRKPNLGERRNCHVSYSQWTLNGQS